MRAAGVMIAACLLGAAPAQDDVLAVEHRRDVRGRDAAVQLLRTGVADYRMEAAPLLDVCRHFAARTGDRLSFCVAVPKDLAGATVTLDLKKVSLWTAMAVVQESTGLRFAFRAGVVFLVPKDAVKPWSYVVVYDLRAQCARLRSFPGPDLRLPGSDDGPLFPPEEESEATVSGFTADGIEALLEDGVTPELWGTEVASLTNNGGLFVVRHTPAGHREIQALLVRLGLILPPRLLVR